VLGRVRTDLLTALDEPASSTALAAVVPAISGWSSVDRNASTAAATAGPAARRIRLPPKITSFLR
jgi:hypothetical protein